MVRRSWAQRVQHGDPGLYTLVWLEENALIQNRLILGIARTKVAAVMEAAGLSRATQKPEVAIPKLEHVEAFHNTQIAALDVLSRRAQEFTKAAPSKQEHMKRKASFLAQDHSEHEGRPIRGYTKTRPNISSNTRRVQKLSPREAAADGPAQKLGKISSLHLFWWKGRRWKVAEAQLSQTISISTRSQRSAYRFGCDRKAIGGYWGVVFGMPLRGSRFYGGFR